MSVACLGLVGVLFAATVVSDGSVDRGTTGSPNGRGRGGGCGPERPVMVLAAVRGVSALVGALLVMFWAASALVVVILGGCP